MIILQERAFTASAYSQYTKVTMMWEGRPRVCYFSNCADCTFNTELGCAYYDNKEQARRDNRICGICSMCRHWQSR